MKRGIIFLLFLLVLPLVSAQQNLVILGLSVPLTIAAPLILIAILILFFLVVYIKDRLPNITKDFSKLNFKKFQIKSKKGEQEEKKKIVTKDYLKEIKKIEKNIPTLSVEELFNNLDPIMREFFSKTFDVPYGFTYSELDEDMEKKKENIGNITEKLSKLKYSGLECTKTEVRDVIEHLKVIIRKHYAPLPKEKQSLFKKIDLIQKIKEKLHYKRIEKEESNIRDLINRGRLLIHKDLPLAMKTYLRSLLLYYKLPIRKKREIHIDLEQFHRELKKTGKHKKELANLTRKIINLKHAGKQISVEGINLVNKISDLLKTEEVLIEDRIGKFVTKGFKKIKLPHLDNKNEISLDNKNEIRIPNLDIKKYHLDIKPPKIILPSIKDKIKSLLNTKKSIIKKRELLEKTIKLPAPTLKLKHELLKIAQPQIPKEKLTKNIIRLRHERSLIYKQLKNLEEMEKKQKQQAGTFIRFRG